MGLSYALTFGVLIWIVLWALGWKSFDAIIPGLAFVVASIAVARVLNYLPGRRRPEQQR